MTKTDIANIALKALGAGRIDDIAANDPVSESCRDMIDGAITDYAQSVVTNAMVTRQTLVRAGTPVDDWAYSYLLPTSPPVLRPVRLASYAEFYREGGLIHTNDENAMLVYVAGGTDIADLPDYACEAIGFRLAVLLASDLGKDERIGAAESLYTLAINRAKGIEGRYNNPAKGWKPWGTR